MQEDKSFYFSGMELSDVLVSDILEMNPWWQDKPMSVLPETRRHLVDQMKTRFERRLAPIVIVRGPRQIGKTVAQKQMISDLLKKGIAPDRIMRLQFEEIPSFKRLSEPILRIVEWYERTVLRKTLNEAAHAGTPACIFLDEVQNLEDWDAQLKFLVDHSTLQMIVTGSSALRLEMGRDSLAGRISTIDAGVLSLTDIAKFHSVDLGNPFWEENGLEALTRKDFWLDLKNHGENKKDKKDRAFSWFSERGGYPIGHERMDIQWEYIADQLNENVIRRVIQHDLRIGEKGRKRDPQLLEETFRLACRYAGQSTPPETYAREVHRAIGANVGPHRITQYLKFLDNTLLIRLIPPLEIRLKRKRGASKICLADHGLRMSWLQEKIPLDPTALQNEPHLTTMAGYIAESVTGSVLSTLGGLDLSHFPERKNEPEVDFVITIGAKRIPIEVKYQRRIDPLRDTEGLRSFIEKTQNNAPFGLLVTQTEETRIDDPRIVSLPLSSLMLLV
ncbi:ATP-binding protein [bacterium]|nr:ATP-binding protein [bacterium]